MPDMAVQWTTHSVVHSTPCTLLPSVTSEFAAVATVRCDLLHCANKTTHASTGPHPTPLRMLPAEAVPADTPPLLLPSRACATPAQNFKLPRNVRATTDAQEAIAGASYAVHAVPVQHSRAFLSGVREVLPPKVPIVCVSKGLEVGSGCMMSEVIPGALGRRQPAVFISGPSFAKEVMQVSGWELQEGPVACPSRHHQQQQLQQQHECSRLNARCRPSSSMPCSRGSWHCQCLL